MKFEEIVTSAQPLVKSKLEDNKRLRERPDYHPEESAYEHIKIVTERLIPTGDMNLVLAGIFHDIRKADTARTNPKNGWPTCPGHDLAAFDLIMENLEIQEWISENGANYKEVANICLNHMKFHQLGNMRPSKKESYVKMWEEEGIWEKLQIFGAADNMLEEFNLNNLEKSWKFNKA